MAAYLRRMTFFVLDGKTIEEVMEERGWLPEQFKSSEEWKGAVVRRIKAEDVELVTSDGRKLKALWSSRHSAAAGPASQLSSKAVGNNVGGNRDGVNLLLQHTAATGNGRSVVGQQLPTTTTTTSAAANAAAARPLRPRSSERSAVLLFHANAQVGLDLCEWARWYRNRDIDALLVTMGGYAGSEGPASEANGYRDAQAALDWVVGTQGLSKHRVLAHGLSIGAALACGLADANPGVHLVLDQAFSHGHAAAVHVANTKVALGEMGFIPDWAVAGIVASCLPSGRAIDTTTTTTTAPSLPPSLSQSPSLPLLLPSSLSPSSVPLSSSEQLTSPSSPASHLLKQPEETGASATPPTTRQPVGSSDDDVGNGDEAYGISKRRSTVENGDENGHGGDAASVQGASTETRRKPDVVSAAGGDEGDRGSSNGQAATSAASDQLKGRATAMESSSGAKYVTDSFNNVKKLRRMRKRNRVNGGMSGNTGDSEESCSLTPPSPSSPSSSASLAVAAAEEEWQASSTESSTQQRGREVDGGGGGGERVDDRGGCDGGGGGDVFIFWGREDDMVPVAFSEALLRARFDDRDLDSDADDEEWATYVDDDDDDDDEEEAEEEVEEGSWCERGGYRRSSSSSTPRRSSSSSLNRPSLPTSPAAESTDESASAAAALAAAGSDDDDGDDHDGDSGGGALVAGLLLPRNNPESSQPPSTAPLPSPPPPLDQPPSLSPSAPTAKLAATEGTAGEEVGAMQGGDDDDEQLKGRWQLKAGRWQRHGGKGGGGDEDEPEKEGAILAGGAEGSLTSPTSPPFSLLSTTEAAAAAETSTALIVSTRVPNRSHESSGSSSSNGGEGGGGGKRSGYASLVRSLSYFFLCAPDPIAGEDEEGIGGRNEEDGDNTDAHEGFSSSQGLSGVAKNDDNNKKADAGEVEKHKAAAEASAKKKKEEEAKAARAQRRGLAKVKLAHARATKTACLGGAGHGSFFGADGNAVSTFEAFLRGIGFLPAAW